MLYNYENNKYKWWRKIELAFSQIYTSGSKRLSGHIKNKHTSF